MSLQALTTIGKERFSLGILSNYDYYTISQSIEDKAYVDDLVVKKGRNITLDFIEAPGDGSIVKLVTFDNGYYIGFKRVSSSDVSVNYGDGSCQQYYVALNFYNANNQIIDLNGSPLNGHVAVKRTIGGVTSVIPSYICAAIDEEKKLGYLVLLRPLPTINNSVASMGTFIGKEWLSGSTLYQLFTTGSIYDPDPWSNGGYGDIGGGDGELDLSSDIIALPDLPTSFTETGFIQIFAPSLAQINDLSNYMWNGTFFDNLLKLFSNPMDIIVGLSMYPFPISTGGQRLVHAGNILTTVNMNYPASQYVTIDCGSIEVKHFYDAYVDYDPYTTCKIYLPYIGVQQLCMDDIMGKTIHVIYRVDLLTGVCAAYILCNDIILYTFSGECSAQIPISGQSFQSIVQSAINIATSTALGAHSTKNVSALENGARSAASSLAGNVMSMKPDVSRSGSISSNVGMLGPQKPYLIFSVPRTCLPKGQNKYLGYPIFMTAKLSELKGYTEVENLWLNNMTCTEEEKKEIEDLLKGGVIL